MEIVPQKDVPISASQIPYKFHFFKVNFTPYNEKQDELNSEKIMHQVLSYLSKEQQAGKGLLIDRYEKREKEEPRHLFVTSAVFMFPNNRVRGSIALLRSGKLPMLKPKESFRLIPIDTEKNSIAEITHFFVDYSTNTPILCVEFNQNGPRASDLEFYFRVVAHDKLKIAKATDVEVIMDTSIDKALAELKNVLNIEVKVQPEKLSRFDTVLVGDYFTSMTTLQQKIQPKFIRLEAMYQTQGKSVTSSQINTGGNNMFRRMLNAFKAKPTNIDLFESFTVKYENKDGIEEVFNLLKGKKEIIKFADSSNLSQRDTYTLIEKDLDTYIQSLR